MLKKIVLGFVIIIFLLVAALALAPILFKDKLFKLVQTEINKRLNATVSIGDVSLSFFSAFPDASFSLDNIVVAGVDNFEGDTLANISTIGASLDIMSVINGEQYAINKFYIISPKFNVIVLADSSANYDIMKPSEPKAEKPDAKESKPLTYNIQLSEYSITNANIIYDDKLGDTYAELTNFNHSGTGDFTQDIIELVTQTTADAVTVKQGGVAYLNKAVLDLKIDLNANLPENKYTLKENTFKLNDLQLGLDGFVQLMEDESINLDLKFNTKETTFKSLLSLVPGAYTKDFEGVEADGNLALEGFATGVYFGDIYPAFGLNLKVADASFQYPDLPTKVTAINIATMVTNTGGDLDNTVVDVSQFDLVLGKEPISIKALIKNVISNPKFDVNLKGKIDLANVNSYYPLGDGVEARGKIDADFSAKGKQSDIDAGAYENVYAQGTININELYYKSVDVPDGVTLKSLYASFESKKSGDALAKAGAIQNYDFSSKISLLGLTYNDSSLPYAVNLLTIQLSIKPEKAILSNMQVQIGQSDFKLHGELQNVLAFALTDDAKIAGNLTVYSKQINANEWLTEEEVEATDAESAEAAIESSEVAVPDYIDFAINLKIDKLLYDNITLSNVAGKATVKNEIASIDYLNANLLGGSAIIAGTYATPNGSNPKVEMNYDITGIEIEDAFKAFNTVDKLVPLADKLTGKFNSKMTFNTSLNEALEPDLKNLLANGIVDLRGAKLSNVKVFNTLADKFKLEEFRSIDLDRVMTVFEIIDGRINVEPFDILIGDIKTNIFGSHGIDNTMDYTMLVDIPSAKLGPVKGYVDGLLSSSNIPGLSAASMPEILTFNVGIKGTVDDPKITIVPASGSIANSLRDQAKAEAKKAANEAKAKLKAEADKQRKAAEERARQEAAKARAEAERQAKAAADKAKKAAEDAANKAKEDAKKKAKDVFNKWKPK